MKNKIIKLLGGYTKVEYNNLMATKYFEKTDNIINSVATKDWVHTTFCFWSKLNKEGKVEYDSLRIYNKHLDLNDIKNLNDCELKENLTFKYNITGNNNG